MPTPTKRKPATRKQAPAEALAGEALFTPLAILATKFDLHCREASRLRDRIHRLATEAGLSDHDEKRLLLDAHDANEAIRLKQKAAKQE